MTLSRRTHGGSSSQKKKEDRSIRKFKEIAPTKIVMRKLPPTMSEEELYQQLDPIPDHRYFSFIQPDQSWGSSVCSRVYIDFINAEDVLLFHEKFDGYVFIDTSDGSEHSAVVEFTPYQHTPNKSRSKPNAKCNTIDKDLDYLSFLSYLENQATATEPNRQQQDTEGSTTGDVTGQTLAALKGPTATAVEVIVKETPLVTFLKQKQEEKAAARHHRLVAPLTSRSSGRSLEVGRGSDKGKVMTGPLKPQSCSSSRTSASPLKPQSSSSSSSSHTSATTASSVKDLPINSSKEDKQRSGSGKRLISPDKKILPSDAKDRGRDSGEKPPPPPPLLSPQKGPSKFSGTPDTSSSSRSRRGNNDTSNSGSSGRASGGFEQNRQSLDYHQENGGQARVQGRSSEGGLKVKEKEIQKEIRAEGNGNRGHRPGDVRRGTHTGENSSNTSERVGEDEADKRKDGERYSYGGNKKGVEKDSYGGNKKGVEKDSYGGNKKSVEKDSYGANKKVVEKDSYPGKRKEGAVEKGARAGANPRHAHAGDKSYQTHTGAITRQTPSGENNSQTHTGGKSMQQLREKRQEWGELRPNARDNKDTLDRKSTESRDKRKVERSGKDECDRGESGEGGQGVRVTPKFKKGSNAGGGGRRITEQPSPSQRQSSSSLEKETTGKVAPGAEAAAQKTLAVHRKSEEGVSEASGGESRPISSTLQKRIDKMPPRFRRAAEQVEQSREEKREKLRYKDRPERAIYVPGQRRRAAADEHSRQPTND